MNLKQALYRRKALEGQYKEWEARLQPAILYAEGDEPAFTYQEVSQRLDTIRKELVTIRTSIAMANASTNIQYRIDHIPLVAAVAMLQELRGELALLKGLKAKNKAESVEKKESMDYDDEGRRHMMQKEVKWFSLCTAVDLVRIIERKQADFDELNNLVEDMNNKTPC